MEKSPDKNSPTPPLSMDDAYRFALFIEQELKKINLPSYEIAQHLRISYESLRSWLDGTGFPSHTQYQKIADFFKVDLIKIKNLVDLSISAAQKNKEREKKVRKPVRRKSGSR